MDMANPRLARSRTNEQVILALQRWADERGRTPKSIDWARGTLRRPSRTTVYEHFGSWGAALSAASLSSPTPARRRASLPRAAHLAETPTVMR
jgi:hypothetical protein